MFDSFDPRWDDDVRDRRDDDERDRNHDDGLVLGRGAGSHKLDDHHSEPCERDDDWREARDRDGQDRDVHDRDGFDPRDVFVRDLDLPSGHERERVLDRDRTYELNGQDSRTLATVGAFRVVPERDLRGSWDGSFDGRDTDLTHLRDEGLVRTVPLNATDRAVVLTERGRRVLEGYRRDGDPEHRQVKRSTPAPTSLGSGPTMRRSIAPTSARRSGCATATRTSCACSSTAS